MELHTEFSFWKIQNIRKAVGIDEVVCACYMVENYLMKSNNNLFYQNGRRWFIHETDTDLKVELD